MVAFAQKHLTNYAKFSRGWTSNIGSWRYTAPIKYHNTCSCGGIYNLNICFALKYLIQVILLINEGILLIDYMLICAINFLWSIWLSTVTYINNGTFVLMWKWWCFRPLLCTLFRLNWAKQTPGIMRRN